MYEKSGSELAGTVSVPLHEPLAAGVALLSSTGPPDWPFDAPSAKFAVDSKQSVPDTVMTVPDGPDDGVIDIDRAGWDGSRSYLSTGGSSVPPTSMTRL